MTEEIKINGVSFTPVEGIKYKYDYVEWAKKIEDPSTWQEALGLSDEDAKKVKREDVEKALYRYLVLNDLWFILYFIMGLPDYIANTPFAVNQCKLIEGDDFNGDGYRQEIEDIWARGHLKTSIISGAETIQYHLKHPEFCTIFFAYKKGLAERIADKVRRAYESEFMRYLFPELLYMNPTNESPLWSIEKGFNIKRKNQTRLEPTIYASGLVEGMAQGFHSERLIFEDFETEDMAKSPEMLNDAFEKFMMAQYLNTKTINDRKRVVGTIYSHLGPMVRIKGLKSKDGSPQYKVRIIPGTEDGAFDGKPVFWSQAVLDKEKLSPHYPMQVLCNPTPIELRKLKSQFFKIVERHEVPRNLLKFMLVDWAGDDKGKRDGCDWAFLVIGIDPKEEETMANDVYLLECVASPMPTPTAVDVFTRMYLGHGTIQKVGIEKSSGDAIKYYAVEMLRQKGRILSEDLGNLMDLNPRGRNKDERILNGLEVPLNSGKLYISKAIPPAMIEKIILETDQFPFGKKDILDDWAYYPELVKDFNFSHYSDFQQYNYSSKPYRMATVCG